MSNVSHGRQIQSLVTADGTLEVRLVTVDIPPPGPGEHPRRPARPRQHPQPVIRVIETQLLRDTHLELLPPLTHGRKVSTSCTRIRPHKSPIS